MTPVKGTVWRHARRKNYRGEPQELTVSSIQPDKRDGHDGEKIVYSRTRYGDRVRTPAKLFDTMCLEVVSTPSVEKVNGPKLTEQDCAALFNKAHAAGMSAADKMIPVSMTVVEHDNPFDDNSPVKQTWHEPEGACGFAWITIHPGNSTFARYVKKHHAGYAAYEGGTGLWVRYFQQSVQRKEAYARAFAAVLNEAGVKAYHHSRLD